MRSVLFLTLACCSSIHANQGNRPNVLFILADDLGWSDTTLYETTQYYRTPNMERLAQRGMTFTQAYSASPLCSPTRSAILTGLSPARTGITTPNCHLPEVVLEATVSGSAAAGLKSVQPTPVTRLKTEYRTLAESLKDAGYATGHFGKWHLGPEPYSPLQQGFDVDMPHHSGPGPAGSYVAPWKFKDFEPSPHVPNQHIEDRMAIEAVKWMEQHAEQPFFLNYWMFSVHAPFNAKEDLIERHRSRIDSTSAQRSPTYAAMIESMDDAVGTLLDALDRQKLADSTIIVFTSDNGGNMYSEVDGTVPTSNAPLRGGKASMFEGGTRVPCVVVWPEITVAASRNDAVIQSEDFYPTLLEGLKLPAAADQLFDGVSILPALRGGELDREAIFQYFPHSPPVPDWVPPSVSVRSGDWKLIRIFHGGEHGDHRYLLFNLKEDLSESTNLAAQKPELVRELDERITKFLIDTNAVVPIANPTFDPAQYRPELEGKRAIKEKGKGKGKNESSDDSKPSDRTKAQDDNDPALKGWKVRGCVASVSKGILSVSTQTDSSFLRFAAGRHRGPSRVGIRLKASPGESHVDWLPDGARGKVQSVPFSISGDWQEVAVDLPATDSPGIVRLYLHKQNQPVEIDWIEIQSTSDNHKTRTDF